MRLLRRLVLIVLVGALGIAALLVFTTRPDIEDARDQLESSWDSAAPALDARFQVLAMVNNSVAETPGPVGEISNEVSDTLEGWLEARAGGLISSVPAPAG